MPDDAVSDPAPLARLARLAQRLGHDFQDLDLLRRALAHRSWCAEVPGEESNERLEFLGDAVLGWVIADLAYHRFAKLPEGMLTDIRKSVVNASALAAIAREIGIGEHIMLGKGEAGSNGADKTSILSDAFEAVLGAVYLDGGVAAASDLVERWVAPRMSASVEHLDELDHKTFLQELAARLGRGAPVYSTTSSGPDHAKVFRATVALDGERLGVGEGRSKKAAEQAAASVAVAALT